MLTHASAQASTTIQCKVEHHSEESVSIYSPQDLQNDYPDGQQSLSVEVVFSQHPRIIQYGTAQVDFFATRVGNDTAFNIELDNQISLRLDHKSGDGISYAPSFFGSLGVGGTTEDLKCKLSP